MMKSFTTKVSIVLYISIFILAGCGYDLDNSDWRPTLSPVEQAATLSAEILSTPPVLDISDGGLISDIPCGSPCFYGITPGITTRNEVPLILTQLGVIDICKNVDYFDNLQGEQIKGWSCQYNFDITYTNNADIIDFIRFTPTRTIYLKDIIESIGEPDIVVFFNPDLPENPSVEVSMYFSKNGTVVHAEKQEGVQYQIKPTTAINVVNYLANEQYQKYLDLFYGNAINWKGYGNYSIE